MKKYLFLITAFLTAFVASGATYYVVPNGAGNKNGTSWANAYADVQTAIDSAYNAGGGEVWIKKGTYKYGTAMKMKNNVHIYGGFAGTEASKEQRVEGNATILDGEGEYRVFYNDYTEDDPLTNTAKIDNVTIQNGYTSGYGAGMYNDYASPEITNCTFANNRASDDGGGMYNRDASPEITNCTFANNSASHGGGMYNRDASPEITNCTFSGNSAYFGGGMDNYECSSTLTNCTFSGNSAEYSGGGMDNSGCSSTLTNCTFADNSAYEGGGMYNYNCRSTFTNCILWGNKASSSGNEIYNYDSDCNPIIDTCIIQGGVDAIYGNEYGTYTNIITADPKLVPLGNYGGSVSTCPVGANSSATGTSKVIDGLITDARGFKRSSTPTIGACEYQNKFHVLGPISTTESYNKYSSSYEFTLNANAPDASNLTYQWYKDGIAVGATSSSYKTSQSAGTSVYTVKVSDGTTTITSSEIAIETIDTLRYYVSTTGSSENDGLSWATAKADVQEAIDLASHVYGGCEVWIAKGTYKHGSAMTMKNNVAIYGGFAGTETNKEQRVAGNFVYLSGEGKYRVFYNECTEANPLTNSAKLDSVTIQNGYGDYGAGMHNYHASPEITNCTFSGNRASDGGGGIYNAYSSSKLTNCTFADNNASDGAGIYYFDYMDTDVSLKLTNCTFVNNKSYSEYGFDSYGGAIINNGSLRLINCTFYKNNVIGYGGAICDLEGFSIMTNCTFVENSATGLGGAFWTTCFSGSSVENCIFWNNTATLGGNEIEFNSYDDSYDRH